MRAEPPQDSPAPRGSHAIGLLQCQDGLWISTGNVETVFWENFCNILDRPDWIPLLRETGEKAARMNTEVHELFLTKPRSEWLEILSQAETCVAPVNDILAAMEDPQMRHVGMVVEMLHGTEGAVPQLGFPVRGLGANPDRESSPLFLAAIRARCFALSHIRMRRSNHSNGKK